MRADRASIEAEIDSEIARYGLDIDLETLAARVAARLGVDAASCLTVARARLAHAGRQESQAGNGVPGKVPSHLLGGRPLVKGPIAPGKRTLTHDSFYRTRVASSTPGKQSVASLLPTQPARPRIENVDELRALLGLALPPDAKSSNSDPPLAEPARIDAAPSVRPPRQSQTLPYQALMEAAFGQSLNDVKVHVRDEALAPHHANAAATKDTIIFANATPRLETVAHEVAHILQYRNLASSGNVSKEASEHRDAPEREARLAAKHVALHGATGAPFQIREQPTAQVHFEKNDETTEVTEETDALPEALEASIKDALRRLKPIPRGRRRKAPLDELARVLRSVVARHRPALLDRLASPNKGDSLASLFRSSARREEQRLLREALMGSAVDFTSVTDVIGQFAQALGPQSLRVPPSPLIIAPWTERASLTARLQAPIGVPADADAADVDWTLFDADGAELFSERSQWAPGAGVSETFRWPVTEAGVVRIRAQLSEAGVVRKTLEANITVELAEGGPDSHGANLAAASSMSPEQLSDETRLVRGRLASSELTADGSLSPEHAGLAGALGAMEVAAGAQGVEIPLPQAGNAVDLSAYRDLIGGSPLSNELSVVSSTPSHARAVLERVIGAHDMDTAEWLPGYVQYASSSLASDPGSPEIADRLARAAAELRNQLAVLKAESAAVQAEFEARASAVFDGLITESEERAGDVIMRYGLVDEDLTRGGTHRPSPGQPASVSHMDESEYADGLAAAARQLADQKQQILDLQKRRDELHALAQVAVTQPMHAPNGDISDVPMVAEVAEYERFAAMLAEAELDYAHMRVDLQGEHPVLATAEHNGELDLNALTQLASGDTESMAAVIGRKIFPVLEKIELLKRHRGDINVWRQTQVVALTKQQLMIAPGSARERFVTERISREQPSFWDVYGIGLISTILGLLAAIPTGGASLGMAAAVAVGAAAAIDTALVLRAIRDYRIDQALAGSDYEKARAISSEDPSLLWLAVEIVAVVAGVGGAAKTMTKAGASFSQVAAARKAVFETGDDLGEATARIDALRAAGHRANLPESVIDDLVEETLEQLPSDIAAALGRGADDALEVADDAIDAAEHVDSIPAPRRPPPTGARREQLLAERGTDEPRLASRPSGWTGGKEAEWRGYPDPPEGSHWYWRRDSSDIDLRRASGEAEAGTTRYHYDGERFVVVADDTIRARYKSSTRWPMSRKTHRRASRFARSRERSRALKNAATDPAEATKHGERMKRASEALGEEVSERWVRSTYPTAEPIYGWPPSGRPGVAGEFDQIWRVRGAADDGGDLYVVVEAKGGTGALSTRRVEAEVVEQGTPAYFEDVAITMQKVRKPGGLELRRALENRPEAIRYVKVRVPVSETAPRHSVGNVSVSDFDAP